MKRIRIFILGVYALLNTATAQLLTSSNLPLVIINTNGQEIPDDPKITADMGIVYNGPGVRNNSTDVFNNYNGKIGIEIRGQSSQMFPMKSYSIELRDNTGNSRNQTLLGMPSESDWVLYAPYNDKTLMHNFLSYTISREMGRWAANCRYVELVLNGDYRGIYVLMERIKRGSSRVNIPKLNTTDVSGDAVTGGYIFSIDKEADAWYSSFMPMHSTGAQTIRFAYVYPKFSAMAQQQKDYLKSYVDSFELALNAVTYQDKQFGWRRYADEGSFIDYFIVNEVSHNVDAYRLSSYFHKNRHSNGGKIIAGPVWDYDLAFRNANYCNGSDTAGWIYEFNKTCPQDYWQVPFWWNRFMDDTAFLSNLRCRWKTLRQYGLSSSRLETLVDSIAILTAEARTRHFQRWQILGQYIWPNPQPVPTTYEGEIETLKKWLTDRLKWIDRNLPNTGACYDYPPNVKESILVSLFPNPFQGQQTLLIRSKMNQQVQIQVIDAAGHTIYTAVQQVSAGNNQKMLVTGHWPPGIFFFILETSLGEKIVLKRLRQ